MKARGVLLRHRPWVNENIASQPGEAGAIPIVGLAVTNNSRF
jgi:hypothetical protein